jgi:hypothetical protein
MATNVPKKNSFLELIAIGRTLKENNAWIIKTIQKIDPNGEVPRCAAPVHNDDGP